MNNETIVQILKVHSINYKIDEAGRIFAEEVYTINANAYSDFIDVTGWTCKNLYLWLGYQRSTRFLFLLLKFYQCTLTTKHGESVPAYYNVVFLRFLALFCALWYVLSLAILKRENGAKSKQKKAHLILDVTCLLSYDVKQKYFTR